MKKIKVLLKKVGRKAEKIEIDDTLEAKQKLVGGLIEVAPFGKYDLVCNEEGKIMALYPNCVLNHDMICGNFFVANSDYETGEFKSLTNEEIENLKGSLEIKSVKYSPIQMLEILRREKELNKEFEESQMNKLVKYYENLENEFSNTSSKDEINNLMTDMGQDLYPEPTEQDLKDMEVAYYLNKENKKLEEHQEFLEQTKDTYDVEEREEI